MGPMELVLRRHCWPLMKKTPRASVNWGATSSLAIYIATKDALLMNCVWFLCDFPLPFALVEGSHVVLPRLSWSWEKMPLLLIHESPWRQIGCGWWKMECIECAWADDSYLETIPMGLIEEWYLTGFQIESGPQNPADTQTMGSLSCFIRQGA